MDGSEWVQLAEVEEICAVLTAMQRFLSLFKLVFDDDWTYTECCLEDANRSRQIRGTFLYPQVDLEHSNWSNRAELLNAYHQLMQLTQMFAYGPSRDGKPS